MAKEIQVSTLRNWATKEERVETPRFPAAKGRKRETTPLQEVCQRTPKGIIDKAA
ncbi:MAG: hypothetical protein NWE91_07940 [Candidatus Bathyarchaeota archaeon]|nr:hypothetical protein [Candidatus Bathyarchaeota archaeon]